MLARRAAARRSACAAKAENETGFGCKCELPLVPDLGPRESNGAMLEIGSLRVPAPLKSVAADEHNNRSVTQCIHFS